MYEPGLRIQLPMLKTLPFPDGNRQTALHAFFCGEEDALAGVDPPHYRNFQIIGKFLNIPLNQ
jgi:hypothetical protein